MRIENSTEIRQNQFFSGIGYPQGFKSCQFCNTLGIEVVPLNGTPQSGMGGSFIALPQLAKGTRLVRMGRAATELDVQTAQFSAMPRKAANNCQIFKMQVEQSTLAKIAGKEVGWSFSDQEEAAIIDMRLGTGYMVKSYHSENHVVSLKLLGNCSQNVPIISLVSQRTLGCRCLWWVR